MANDPILTRCRQCGREEYVPVSDETTVADIRLAFAVLHANPFLGEQCRADASHWEAEATPNIIMDLDGCE